MELLGDLVNLIKKEHNGELSAATPGNKQSDSAEAFSHWHENSIEA